MFRQPPPRRTKKTQRKKTHQQPKKIKQQPKKTRCSSSLKKTHPKKTALSNRLIHRTIRTAVTIAGWMNRRQQEAIEYLRVEARILRERIGHERLVLNESQKRRLATAVPGARVVGARGSHSELRERPLSAGTIPLLMNLPYS
jgi:hypothetical protein